MKTEYVFGDRVKVLPKIDEATEYSDRVKDNKTYLYKDGRVGVVYFDTKCKEGYYSATYTEGTLQEYI